MQSPTPSQRPLDQITMRSWSEFFLASGFSMPTMPKLNERLQVNLVYYQANYLAIFVLFFLYTCVARPFVLIVLLLTAAGAMGLQTMGDQIKMDGKPVPRQYTFGGLAAVSFCSLLLFGGASFIVALCLALLIVILHSVFRKRSIKSRTLSFFDMWLAKTPASNLMNEYEDEEDPEQSRARINNMQARTQFRERMRAKYLKMRPGIRLLRYAGILPWHSEATLSSLR
eukprot:g73.t1